jgi:hypothetical protein
MKQALIWPGLLIGVLPALYLMSQGVVEYFNSSKYLQSPALYIITTICTFAGGILISMAVSKNNSLLNVFLMGLTWMSVLVAINFSLAFAGCTFEVLSSLKN